MRDRVGSWGIGGEYIGGDSAAGLSFALLIPLACALSSHSSHPADRAGTSPYWNQINAGRERSRDILVRETIDGSTTPTSLLPCSSPNCYQSSWELNLLAPDSVAELFPSGQLFAYRSIYCLGQKELVTV